jgi:hypothetical protein
MMRSHRSLLQVLVLAALVVASFAAPAHAGPCTAQIDAMQARVDARLEAVAARGRFGVEARAAKLQHQPTPDSIAGAEQRLDEGWGATQAAAALDRARDADKSGDEGACIRALTQVRRTMVR